MVDFDQSAAEFGVLRKLDPYSLEFIDIFSHVLFVMVKESWIMYVYMYL